MRLARHVRRISMKILSFNLRDNRATPERQSYTPAQRHQSVACLSHTRRMPHPVAIDYSLISYSEFRTCRASRTGIPSKMINDAP